MISPGQRGQVLILLAAWLFFFGGASSAVVAYDRPASEVKKSVKRVIKDADRRDVILSYVSLWESIHDHQDERVGEVRKALLEMLRRKDTRRSEVEPLLAQLDATFLEMDQDFLNYRFRVKEQVTNAEWTEIVARTDR